MASWLVPLVGAGELPRPDELSRSCERLRLYGFLGSGDSFRLVDRRGSGE